LGGSLKQCFSTNTTREGVVHSFSKAISFSPTLLRKYMKKLYYFYYATKNGGNKAIFLKLVAFLQISTKCNKTPVSQNPVFLQQLPLENRLCNNYFIKKMKERM
jgi:hypothetical protein